MRRRNSITIPQADPLAGYKSMQRDIDKALKRVLESGVYVLGHEVEMFEQEFSCWLGRGYAVGVGSGTDALEVALRSLGVCEGDAVFTVSLTSVATVMAILRCGATPVLVDVGTDDLLMDPVCLEREINALVNSTKRSLRLRPAAVVPVHLYGMPADMSLIMGVARKYGLKVVEDCAQAHGASVRMGRSWRKVGTVGDAGCFSFYPTKNLGCMGDGGGVVLRRQKDAAKAFALRQYGWDAKRVSRSMGLNTRLDELQAAILRARLTRLDKLNEMRAEIARTYDACFVGVDAIVRPSKRSGRRSVNHQYVVRVNDRGRVVRHIQARGVSTAVHYPVPVHKQPAFRKNVIVRGGCLPVTEEVSHSILSLPMFPELGRARTERVGRALLDSLA